MVASSAGVSSKDDWILADPVLVNLRAVASEVMRRHPAVDCVLVYGSRARGDWGDRSDYDLAVMMEDAAVEWRVANQIQPDRKVHPDVEIDCQPVGSGKAFATRHILGTLAHELYIDGRPLVGEWNRDAGAYKTAAISDEAITSNLEQMALHLVTAGRERMTVAAGRARNDAKRQVQLATQMMGEMWAKSVLMTLRIRPYMIHHMDELSEQIEGSDPQATRWRRAIRDLNGHTHKLHMSTFYETEVLPLAESDRRFRNTVRCIGEWFEGRHLVTTADAGSEDKRARMLAAASRKVGEAIDTLRGMPLAGRLPKDVAAAINRLDGRRATNGGGSRL